MRKKNSEFDGEIIGEDSSHWIDDSSHWIDDSSHWIDDSSHWIDDSSHWIDDSSHWIDDILGVISPAWCVGCAFDTRVLSYHMVRLWQQGYYNNDCMFVVLT